MKIMGFDANGNKIGSKKTATSGHAAQKASAAHAQRKTNMAAAAAAAANAAKQSAQEKVVKARAAIERQQKKTAPRSKWEKWYKEKVHKVNMKLKADKRSIVAHRNAQIAVAKAKARKAGAHVADLRL